MRGILTNLKCVEFSGLGFFVDRPRAGERFRFFVGENVITTSPLQEVTYKNATLHGISKDEIRQEYTFTTTSGSIYRLEVLASDIA